jgi:hypothetical protein
MEEKRPKNKNLIKEHSQLIIAVLFLAAAVILDMRQTLFPGLEINVPSMDACWNMFEAQVGVSAVGLTIVSLIISIVSTSTYGMSLPEFIMKIRPKWYLNYTFVVVSVILAVAINWFMLINNMEFTAIYIFLLTTFLAAYLTYSAMQIIYVKDNIKTEVREYILDKKRPYDISNLYMAISENIKTGDFIKFMENLELAKELLLFEIENWEEDIYSPKKKKKKGLTNPHYKSFGAYIYLLVESAIVADNNRFAIEIMEYYYKALNHANDKNVCIEWQSFVLFMKLFKTIDFDYLHNIKMNSECTYEDFLKAQFNNHNIPVTESYKENTGLHYKSEHFYTNDFYISHYYQLYYSKHKEKITENVYKTLIDFAENTPCVDCTDYYRLFLFYRFCFFLPQNQALEILVGVRSNSSEILNRVITNYVNNFINRLLTLTNESDFTLSKEIYICIRLYIFRTSYLKDTEWYIFADEQLSNFYIGYYKKFMESLGSQGFDFFADVFRYFLRDLKQLDELGSDFFSSPDMNRYKSFIVYSIMCVSADAEMMVDGLECIFEKEELYGSMFVEFLGSDTLYESYTYFGYSIFCDTFKIDEYDDEQAKVKFDNLKTELSIRKKEYDLERSNPSETETDTEKDLLAAKLSITE